MARRIMTSSLAALWRYARAEKIEALENFSTEAVAAAIRSDQRPFVELLRVSKATAAHRPRPDRRPRGDSEAGGQWFRWILP